MSVHDKTKHIALTSRRYLIVIQGDKWWLSPFDKDRQKNHSSTCFVASRTLYLQITAAAMTETVSCDTPDPFVVRQIQQLITKRSLDTSFFYLYKTSCRHFWLHIHRCSRLSVQLLLMHLSIVYPTIPPVWGQVGKRGVVFASWPREHTQVVG